MIKYLLGDNKYSSKRTGMSVGDLMEYHITVQKINLDFYFSLTLQGCNGAKWLY